MSKYHSHMLFIFYLTKICQNVEPHLTTYPTTVRFNYSQIMVQVNQLNIDHGGPRFVADPEDIIPGMNFGHGPGRQKDDLKNLSYTDLYLL